MVGADDTAAPLSEERKNRVILSPELLADGGFGILSIDNSDGTISIPTRTSLTAPIQGSITLRAANLEIGGAVTAPGGTLNFSVFNFSPYFYAKLKQAEQADKVTPPVAEDRGLFTLGPAATLSTAGLITDYHQRVCCRPRDGQRDRCLRRRLDQRDRAAHLRRGRQHRDQHGT